MPIHRLAAKAQIKYLEDDVQEESGADPGVVFDSQKKLLIVQKSKTFPQRHVVVLL